LVPPFAHYAVFATVFAAVAMVFLPALWIFSLGWRLFVKDGRERWLARGGILVALTLCPRRFLLHRQAVVFLVAMEPLLQWRPAARVDPVHHQASRSSQ
jgi:hypothetical protein